MYYNTTNSDAEALDKMVTHCLTKRISQKEPVKFLLRYR